MIDCFARFQQPHWIEDILLSFGNSLELRCLLVFFAIEFEIELFLNLKMKLSQKKGKRKKKCSPSRLCKDLGTEKVRHELFWRVCRVSCLFVRLYTMLITKGFYHLVHPQNFIMLQLFWKITNLLKSMMLSMLSYS